MSKQRKHIKIEAAAEDLPAAEVVVAPEGLPSGELGNSI